MHSKYLLALNAHEKIGSQTLKKALAPFSDNVEKLWQASESELMKKMEEKIARLILEARKKYDPEAEIRKLDKLNIGYVTMYDKGYPKLLLEAPDCPVVLYIRGNAEVLGKPSIGVVGSRKFTSYGGKVAKQFSGDLADGGLIVVSGLALGIDAIAHQTTLEHHGITIGVLGCGLDRIYPATNLSLGREILQRGGAVISEFSPGTPPLKHNFPARNRIIAGLSLGTVVIEAAEESGALITAFQALEYNREVFAVPGNIDSEMSKGTNLLIKKGASLVLSAADIFAELNIESKKSEQKARELLPSTPEEEKILEILHSGEKIIDEIVIKSELNIAKINMLLSVMEMKGMVENLGGGRYKRR